MHNRNSFYKYVTVEVAKIALINKTLRWSSPLLFDDPYDVTRQMALGIEPREIQQCTVNEIERIVKNNEGVSKDFNLNALSLWAMFKIAHKNNMLDEVLGELRCSAKEMVPNDSSLNELREMWQKLMPTFRILCLSARNDIELMWRNYADNHKGVVLEFSCIKEFDPPWIIAKPVLYEDRPSLLDKAGWGKLLTLNQDKATQFIFDESCHTKTTAWAYQEEWRILNFSRPDEYGHYSDFRFTPQTLSNVYLGDQIDVENKRSILSLLKNELSHVNVYHGQIKNDSIEFKAMSAVS